jgi:hypothetical protein
LQTNSPGGISRDAMILLAAFLVFTFLPSAARAQSGRQNHYYSRRNSFGIFIAYSNDSSHMLLGDAEQRKLFEVGASYSRRLIIGRIVNWQYSAEFLPVALEGDPLTRIVNDETSPVQGAVVINSKSPVILCHPPPYAYEFADGYVTYAGTETLSCHGRRWTIGEAMSPVGLQWNFHPASRLQPFLICHGGYMFSTREIPVTAAGSFNFTFDIGGGLELYRTPSRSLRLEYRYHHISNDETANVNPGIDNGLVQVTYSFGR